MFFQGSQKALDGAGEQPQPGEMGHVGCDLSRVEPLLSGGKARCPDHLPGHVREGVPGLVVGADQGAEVVEGLLADMGLKAVNIQGVVPAEIELQSPQHLHVREVVPFP